MSGSDVVIAALVLAGCVWLLYRSLWKARGHCHGCSGGGCARGRSTSEGLVKLNDGARR